MKRKFQTIRVDDFTYHTDHPMSVEEFNSAGFGVGNPPKPRKKSTASFMDIIVKHYIVVSLIKILMKGRR